jgi:hypothetical protein
MGDGPSTTTNQSGTSAPWAPQQQYLLDAFKAAQSNYDKNTSQGAYQGDYVAQPSQQQYDAYGNAVTQGYNAQNYNNGLLSSGASVYNTGAEGASGALSRLGNFAGGNQTDRNIADAQKYASGFDINGAVDAGMLEARQNATEQAMPDILRQSAASGGINSDRAALAEGVVARGLAQQETGLRAQLANSAYQNGLSNAQQGSAQRLQADAQAGSIGDVLTKLGFASQTSGINNQTTINAQTTGGANGVTGLDQQTLNNLMMKYNGGQQFTTDQLKNLMAIVGGNYGSQTTGTSTQQQNPSLMQNIGSGVGIAAALFCDRNIKHVYAETGRMWRGIVPEYYFSYRDDHLNKVHRGPMAQDVELIRPDAVTTIGGVKVILTDRI